MKGECEEGASLLADLSVYIQRFLGSTLARRAIPDDDLADLTQETMAQLVGSLHSFRGDSALPTWAASVATRVAHTELRRRAAREAKHAAFHEAQSDALAQGASVAALADGSVRDEVITELRAAIDEDLTDRQRVATLALLRGIPTIEIAEQLGSNQNAVYKVVHDARLKLLSSLQRRGVTVDKLGEMAAARGEQ